MSSGSRTSSPASSAYGGQRGSPYLQTPTASRRTFRLAQTKLTSESLSRHSSHEPEPITQPNTQFTDSDYSRSESSLPRNSPQRNFSAIPAPDSEVQPDFRVSVDVGTTKTAITYVKRRIPPQEVQLIEGFPGDPGLDLQMPTLICYRIRRGHIYDSGPKDFLIGHEAEDFCNLPSTAGSRQHYTSFPIRQIKTLFYEDEDDGGAPTKHKQDLLRNLDHLIEAGIVETYEEVITDLLVKYLEHTKAYLVREHGLKDGNVVELVVTVPVCWNTHSTMSMNNIFIAAMKRTNFGLRGDLSEPNVFLVNEAEAAATYAFKTHKYNLNTGEDIIVCDIGGGTADFGAYRTTSFYPLRIQGEILKPIGARVGSADLEAAFEEFSMAQLRRETYLETREITIRMIVKQYILPIFESRHKRTFKYEDKEQVYSYRISGLRRSASNPMLGDGHFDVAYDQMCKIFEPSLAKIERLLMIIVDNAMTEQIEPKKVLLVGGYSNSPALRKRLEACLQQLNKKHGLDMGLITTIQNSNAVALGANVRAEDKRFGPRRVPHVSYGVMSHIEWFPESDLDYMKQDHPNDEFDGIPTIYNTIKWIIKANKGPEVPTHMEPFLSIHCFEPWDNEWKAEEVVFVSETCTEDGYKLDHPKNEGKVKMLGTIQLDLSPLRGRVELTRKKGQRRNAISHYQVMVRVEMTVIDRNLRFQVRFPSEESGEVIEGAVISFNIAGAFDPGTK